MDVVKTLSPKEFEKLVSMFNIEYSSQVRCGSYGYLIPQDKVIVLKNTNTEEDNIDTVVHECMHYWWYEKYKDLYHPIEDNIEYDTIRYMKKFPEVREYVREKLKYADDIFENMFEPDKNDYR